MIFLFDILLFFCMGSAACGVSHSIIRRPPLGAGRVEPHSGFCRSPNSQTPKASAGQPSAADPAGPARPLPPQIAFFPNFTHTFGRSKFHQKSDPSKSHPKSQKCHPRALQGRLWRHFSTHFGTHFHQKSRHPENAYFVTSTERELDFGMPKAPMLASFFD